MTLYVALRAVTGAVVLAPLMAANFVLYAKGMTSPVGYA
jgi:hypothetical protein